MPLKVSLDSAMYQIVLFLAFVAPLSTAAASIGVGLGVVFLLVCYVRARELPQFDFDLLEVLAVYLVCELFIATMSLEPSTSLREVFGELHHFIPLVFAMTFIKKREQLCGVLIATLAAALINDVAGRDGFSVDMKKTVLYGVCSKCRG